jgi:divalent metal cation (Fe/Co/Zn/Cd) transporter
MQSGTAERVIRLGFWVNARLMAVKLLAGSSGHSEAVFADRQESACHFVALSSAPSALKISRTPLDQGHP